MWLIGVVLSENTYFLSCVNVSIRTTLTLVKKVSESSPKSGKPLIDFYAKNLTIADLVSVPLNIMIMHPTTLAVDSFAICYIICG